MSRINRRNFLRHSAGLAAGVGLFGMGFAPRAAARSASDTLFKISLAEWSLHKTLFSGKLDNLDFPRTAKHTYGIEAVEYVNQFFKDKANDQTYLSELKTRAEGEGVTNVLIMVDGEGFLGDPDEAARLEAVENHHKWVEAAQFLGCHSIRVNAYSRGTYEEQTERAADGLRRLCEFADPYGINVIVENHGGLSSNGAWLVGVMKAVDHPRVGTLPDFGNFRLSEWGAEKEEWYDRYEGVAEMMPFAKGVSAKSHDFDAEGNEKHTDFARMMKIVLDAGYRGYVGIEYEGQELDEDAGIKATKALLERVRTRLAPEYG